MNPKTGDDLTFSFTFSETLSTAPTVTIEGASATFTKNDNTYTATYQVTDATAEGPIAYDIDTLTDSAGQSFDPRRQTARSLLTGQHRHSMQSQTVPRAGTAISVRQLTRRLISLLRQTKREP